MYPQKYRKGMTIEMIGLEAEIDMTDLEIKEDLSPFGVLLAKPFEELTIKIKKPKNIKVINQWGEDLHAKSEYKIIIDVQGIITTYETEKEEKDHDRV